MSRVLLVDDEKNVLMTLAIGLQRNDFSVEKAQNGPQALEMLRKQSFDFVVSDIRMLPMDGYTLASKIHKQHPDVRIILMSAYGFEAKRHKKGFVQLTKPFEMSDLVRLLRQEDAKRKNARGGSAILLVAEANPENAKIVNVLKELGFQVNRADTEKTLKKELDGSGNAMILIEETFLRDERWKVLNLIDKRRSGLPMAVIADKKHTSRHNDHSGIACMERARLIRDPEWAFRFLNDRMRLPVPEAKSGIS